MKTYYTKTAQLKGRELENILSLLNFENTDYDIGVSNMFRFLETKVNSIPTKLSEYDDLYEVPFSLVQINQYLQSLSVNAVVKKQ